ncbi:TrbI/VirB10 family protein [Kosakonia sp. S42]|uniref:TrbI/VirB10 family protein n=1 Tax=Kosakonia sp. S42 TaxID=2767458 RepID=UPI001F2453D0|nr:TrbI/VirB10 family protein [Kosakonia sp. S42]
MVWNRIILPDTSSLTLDNLDSTDPAGYAGLEDDVDWHWDRVFAGGLPSCRASVLNWPRQKTGRTAIASSSSGVTARRIASIRSARDDPPKSQLQLTLTSRPGLPVRIIVARDLILRAYQPLFFNGGTSR